MRGRAIENTPTQKTIQKSETQRVRAVTEAKQTIEVADNAGDFIQPLKKPLGISFYGRYVPEKSDHGKLYFNMSYQLLKDLRVGADIRPLTGDVSLLANWRVLPETNTRPALMLGTSHDEFGKVASQAYFGTVSKHLFSHNDLHFSAYGGSTYIEKLNEFRPVGGAVMNYKHWSTTLMYSGSDTHWVLSRRFDKHTVSILFFALDLPGIAYGVHF